MLCSWICLSCQFAHHIGNLPTVGNHPTVPVVLWLLALCQKIWQVANSTRHDTTQSQPEPSQSPVAKNGSKRHIFPFFLPWPLTCDLDLQKIRKRSLRPMSMPKIKVLGPTVTAGEAVTDRRKRRKHIYGCCGKTRLIMLFLETTIMCSIYVCEKVHQIEGLSNQVFNQYIICIVLVQYEAKGEIF